MFLVSKQIDVLGVRYHCKFTSHLKTYNRLLPYIKKKLKSFKKLIILRSPKHFNKGKLQLFQGNSSLILYYPINYKLFSVNWRLFFMYILKYFPLQPTSYLMHIEVNYSFSTKLKI